MNASLTMPPEWAPHDRTWMAWPGYGPSTSDLDAAGVDGVQRAWAAVANAIVRFEPVTVLASPDEVARATALLDDRVEILAIPLDDAWMRDMGPTFVHDAQGDVHAVDWVFNGWGAQDWASWDLDQHVAREVAEHAGVPVVASPLVNEGGGIHVDGSGTVLVTRTVQLDAGRNPDWSAEQVEDELARTIGVGRVIWLERGLTRDYRRFGTRGHVDIVAAFAGPGTVLVHDQQDPRHPDHAVSAEAKAVLGGAGDWTVVPVPAPTVLEDEHGWVDYSYINHYVCNGAVILCAFDDPNDEVAARLLADAYPGREIVLVDARMIFARGGGIHCITQQQPAPRR